MARNWTTISLSGGRYVFRYGNLDSEAWVIFCFDASVFEKQVDKAAFLVKVISNLEHCLDVHLQSIVLETT